ncbi:hypothetical protein [Desulfurobacterium sp.]
MIKVSLASGFGLNGVKNKGEKKGKHSLFDVLFSAFSESEKTEIPGRKTFLPHFWGSFNAFLNGSDEKTSLLNKNKEEILKHSFAYGLDKEINSSEKKECFLKSFVKENPDFSKIFNEKATFPLNISGKQESKSLKKQFLENINFSEKETDDRPKNINLSDNAQRGRFQLKLKLSKASLSLKHAGSKSGIDDFLSKKINRLEVENQEKNKLFSINEKEIEWQPAGKKEAEETAFFKNLPEDEKKKIKQKVLYKRAVKHVVGTSINSERVESSSENDVLKVDSGDFKNVFKGRPELNNKIPSRQTVSASPVTLGAVPVLADKFGAKDQVALANQNKKEKIKANFRHTAGFDNSNNINVNEKSGNLALNFDNLPVDEIQKEGESIRNNVLVEDVSADKMFVKADSKLMREAGSGKEKTSLNGSLSFTRNEQSGEKRPLVINTQKFEKKPIPKRDKRFKVVSHKGHFDLSFSEGKTLTSKVKSNLTDLKEVQVSNISTSPGRDASHKVNLSHENVSQAPVVSQKPLHDGSSANRGFSHTGKGQENQAANSEMKYTLTATFEDMRVRASMVRKFLNISIELPQAVFNTAGLSDEIREILSNTSLSGFRVKIKSRGKNLYSETFYKEEESSSVEIRV